MSSAYADRLSRMLEGTGLVEVVKTGFADSRINVLCRVQKEAEPKWIDLLQRLLISAETEEGEPHAWQSHFCRHYFLKEISGTKKMVFGWNLSIQAVDLSSSLDCIAKVIKGGSPEKKAKVSKGEVMEMEFSGVSGDRVPNEKGKGAYTVGGKNDLRVGRR